MLSRRTVAVATTGLMLILLCGCASTRGRLIAAADTLEGRADALAGHALEKPPTVGGGGYLQQASGFAEQARDFRQTVGERRTGDLDILNAYEDLWRSYHVLLDHAERGQDPRTRPDLGPVKDAFVDVQRLVKNGYSGVDGTVYARGGYVLDPYYN
jgi:hypothetical protein